MFSNLTIRSKLTLGIGSTVLLICTLVIFDMFTRSSQNKMHKEMIATTKHQVLITETQHFGAELYQITANAIVNRDLSISQRNWNEKKEEIEKSFIRINDYVDSDKQRPLLSSAQNAYKKLIRVVEDRLFPILSTNEDAGKVRSIDDEIDKLIDEMIDPLAQIALIVNGDVKDIEKKYNTSSTAFTMITSIVVIFIIIFSVIVLITLTRSITNPLNTVIEALKDIAEGEGDLTKTIPVLSKDEIGELSQRFNTFIHKMRSTIDQMIHNTVEITQSSKNLSNISEQVAEGSLSLSNQSNTLASVTAQATTNISSISASAEEMSTSVTTVATAIEEMSASLNEVAHNCQKELEIANQANQQTKSTQSIMENLRSAAQEIGKIVDLINDIADQTNLLALNATIEAASAGDAGKGFAVVATEVKELARQTAQATQNIIVQVEGMQSNTTKAVNAIELIAQIIEEVNTISQTIVSAVEQQSATVNEISSSISGASGAATEIARSVSESARGLSDVTDNINKVNSTVTNTTQGINTIRNNSKNLSTLCGNLEKIVKQFKS